MKSTEIMATLVTNLRAPRVDAAFEQGSEKAQDRLSIPVRTRLDLGDSEARLDSFQLFCIVVLVALKPNELLVDDMIARALAEAVQRERSTVLLVAIPADTLKAGQYFEDKEICGQSPFAVSVDGVETVDMFADVIETFVVTSANRLLPPSLAIDKTQIDTLEDGASTNQSVRMITLPWSLS